MNRILKLTLSPFLLFASFATIVAQKAEPAYVYIYRTNKVMCNPYTFDIQFKGVDIYSMKKNTALEYQFFHEGKLKIEAKNWMNSWSSTLWLNIESGKKYFVKLDCSLSGLNLSTNPSTGYNEWLEASKGTVMNMLEDPNVPLLESIEQEKTVVKVRTDTVKQIVYVNNNTTVNKKYVYEPFSDVDMNIPLNPTKNELTFALIIGNEDYASHQTDLKAEANVEFARNDASTFKEYALKTLGLPEKNVILLYDATYGQMNQAIAKINMISKNTGGKAKIIFYYAGHGMPDETSKEPYIIPVDINGSNISSAIKLRDVYSKLTENASEQVVVFLDACFSGGARNQGLLASRGISIKPKEEFLSGNIAVLSSSSGIQSSLSYQEKKHGLYTYYLLKKLQESKGDVNLKDLNAYLKEKVGLEAVLINSKEQNPQVNTSAESLDKWESWKLK